MTSCGDLNPRVTLDPVASGSVAIATKVFNPMGDDPNQRGLSRKHIRESIDASLRRLRTDYVDLYQIHRFDYETPIEETLSALDDVVRAGKALYIGAPNAMFLALEHALAEHGGVVAAAFSSYAGFDHLHDELFDAVVLNGAQDSATALSLC